MVLLTAMPCSDEAEFRNEISIELAHISSDDHSGCTETCSPICACACCGQNLVQDNFVQLEFNLPTLIGRKTVTLTCLSLKQRANNIWQPPKLA